MAHTILGLFSDQNHANLAIDELQSRGFNPQDISVIVSDSVTGEPTQTTGDRIASGVASGATTGGLLGALAGLLVGVGAVTIPGIGAVLVGGPIASALGITGAAATATSGAITGALAGGLVGALANLGIPEETARLYEEKIKTGAILLAVPADEKQKQFVVDTLSRHGVDQLTTIGD